MDSLEGMRQLKQQGIIVDLIVTDPPYEITNTTPGGKSEFSKSIEGAFKELQEEHLTQGITKEYLDCMVSLQSKINIYIWCNGSQIPFYLDYFVKERKCKFDILLWNKTNAIPTFYNKYLTDKEYVLYFRKGGYCKPNSYEDAKTIYFSPINAKDKKKYGHPTIKPLDFIKRMIRNSSKENEIVLDPFSGSGTTALACKELNRRFIAFEIVEKYYKISLLRLQENDQ
ncbi:MAG: site-specific DNA-methyltransferase [Anaeroplasmataceae bacterium]|nr:site-specific DNA-methyltransferase [Anaeroplasmataceae bacterium]